MSQVAEPDFDNMTDDEMIEFFALDDAVEDSKRYPETETEYCCEFCDEWNTVDEMVNVVNGVKPYISRSTCGTETYSNDEYNICKTCFDREATPCRYDTGIIFIDSIEEEENHHAVKDDYNYTPTDFNPHTEFDLYRDKYNGQ